MPFKTGHKPDHPAVVAARLGLHLHPEYGSMRAGTLPLQTTNRMSLPLAKGGPGVSNQNDTNTCEAHAHGSGGTLAFALGGTPLPEPLSPVCIAYGMYTVDEQPNADGSLPGLFDVGTAPSSVLQALMTWGADGISKWGQFPASTRTMYANPDDAAQVHAGGPLIGCPPEKFLAARACRVQGAYFVQTSGVQRVLDIMRVLAAKKTASIAIPASGPEFQNYSGGILSTLSGPVDHANLLLDYVWTGSQGSLDSFVAAVASGDVNSATALMANALYFIDLNSWGEGWGTKLDVPVLGGLCQLGPQLVANDQMLQDPCVLDFVRLS